MTEKYLNNNVLTKVFEKIENRDVVIKDFEISMGSKKGDNYSSDIYRVNVNYEVDGVHKTLPVIAKYMLDSESIKQIMEEYEVTKKEREMYAKHLPKMFELTGIKFGPECYYITDDNVVFFLEDLKNDGYDVADRTLGLDLNHTKLVIEKLAKFHATSMVLAENEPEVFKSFSKGMVRENADFTFDMWDSSITLLLGVIEKWEGFEEIVEKVKKININSRERLLKCYYQESDFKALNHGDCWTNNFMFKYTDKQKAPVDVALVIF